MSSVRLLADPALDAALMVTGQVMSSYRRFAEHIQSLAGLRDGSLKFDDRSEDLLAHAGSLAGLLMLRRPIRSAIAASPG